MKLKETVLSKAEKRKIIFLYLIILFLLNICVNSFMKIKLLCLDDLDTWNEFSKMNDLQMIFNTSANKFRPVYYLVLNLCYKFFLPRIYLFGVFNLILNFFVIVLIFYIILKITNRTFIAFFGCAVYTVSRFAYYSISQVHGIMEQMALANAILILFFLLQYIIKNNKKFFYISCALFFVAPFIHERYMVLYLLFIFALFLAPKSSYKLEKTICFFVSTIVFSVPFFIRLNFLKSRAFDGTGGTNMKDTFNFTEFLRHFKSGLFYLVGINDGPTHLNGLQQSEALSWVKFLNLVSILIILSIILFYLYFLLKNINKKYEIKTQIKINFLICLFIILTLVCSCVTIRLEMRWIYTPYVGFIVLISNIISYIGAYLRKYFCVSVALSLLFVIFPVELYFRNNYKNIYYWRSYQIYNSIYDVALARYKKDFWNKRIVIISKDETVFGKNAEFLKMSLKMLDPNKNINIIIYDSLQNIPKNFLKDDSIILLAIDEYNQKVINLNDI